MNHKKCGIIAGLDCKQEYLLNPFYINLRLHTDLPITFFDFGMSLMGRRFCEDRGDVISIDESLYQNNSDESRELKRCSWFKKPLACHQAPYDLNLWIDLDCVIRAPLDEIFNQYDFNKWIYIVQEYVIRSELKEVNAAPLPIYNSGFFVFAKNSPIIEKWVNLSKTIDKKHLGDQDVLSFELYDYQDKIQRLDPLYNCLLKPYFDPIPDLNLDKKLELLPAYNHHQYYVNQSKVLHFAASTKSYMLAMHLELEKLLNKKTDYVPRLSEV